MRHFLFFIFYFLFLAAANGQVHEHDHEHDHDHSHDHHHHHEQEKIYYHMNEIALGNAPVYFINEDLSSIGLHFHYLRKQKNGKMWGGFFYERIFQERPYNNIGLTASYSIIDEWQISLTPGISFSTQDQTVQYMMLFESSYKFIIHDFHLGPFLSAGYDIQGYRLSLGLHLGYGF